MLTPKFDVPQTKQVTLTRAVWVKGKGMPKNGVCLFGEGERVTLKTDNGTNWYLPGWYKGKEIRVATMAHTL